MFDSPNGIDVDRDGNVYVADSGNHLIRRITADGVVSTLAGSERGFRDGKGASARFDSPYGVAVLEDFSVVVADTGNHAIRRISQDGEVTTLAGGTEGLFDATGRDAKFRSPFSLTASETGMLYVADAGNNAIRSVTPAGVVKTLNDTTAGRVDGALASARFFVPNDLSFTPDRGLYVADFNNHLIRRIDLALATVATVAGSGTPGSQDGLGTAASLDFPTGLATDRQGRVWIADNQGHRIRILSTSGQVTTFAGSSAGFQDGSATQARFNEPTDLVVDRSDNAYVADTRNHRIRKFRIPN